MEEKFNNQKEIVLNHFLMHGSITSLEAINEYGITRLADVIFKLRKMGFLIKTEMKTSKNRFGVPVSFAVYKYGGLR